MKYFSGLFFGVLFCCALFSFRFPISAFADIRINEIAWMGTTDSQYSEWIELYNDGANAMSLAGWKLYKTGNALLFTLSKTIAAAGYLLIERTTASAPDAVSGIDDESGTFGAGGLKNSGDDLILKDSNGNTVDSVLFAAGWPAGDSKTKDTMQWDGKKWITAPGTPDAANTTTGTSSSTTVPASNVQTPITIAPPITTEIKSTPPQSIAPVVSLPAVSSPDTTVIPVAATSPASVSIPVSIVSPVQTSKNVTTVPSKPKPVVSKVKNNKKSSIENTTDEVDASQLQDVPVEPSKENNHIKLVVLGVVVFIGMALLLLLGRFKASQE